SRRSGGWRGRGPSRRSGCPARAPPGIHWATPCCAPSDSASRRRLWLVAERRASRRAEARIVVALREDARAEDGGRAVALDHEPARKVVAAREPEIHVHVGVGCLSVGPPARSGI